MPTNAFRTVLVTGATRGIGAAVVERFRNEGARIIGTGTSASDVARLNDSAPVDTTYVQVDFCDQVSLDDFLAYVTSLDRLDVCINNAGINIIKPYLDVTIDDFDRVAAVDFRAPYLIAQSAARVMSRQRRGWIVNVGSVWSIVTKRGRTPYCSAKSGLAGMTRAMATDLASAGILVNCISPGFVRTEMTSRSLSEEEMRLLAAAVPLGRFAVADEIAEVIAFLASEHNTYLTGQNVVVDGGFTNV